MFYSDVLHHIPRSPRIPSLMTYPTDHMTLGTRSTPNPTQDSGAGHEWVASDPAWSEGGGGQET